MKNTSINRGAGRERAGTQINQRSYKAGMMSKNLILEDEEDDLVDETDVRVPPVGKKVQTP